MEKKQRFSSQAGIAIGPILFIIALLAVLAMAVAGGGGDFQTASIADRVAADIASQANLIRNTINNCNMQYQMALSMGSPTTAGTDGYPAAASAADVNSLLCDPMGTGSLWNNGTNNILLPPATSGFNDWTYINGGASGGRCIYTTPISPSTASTAGLIRAASKFNSAATATGTNEVLYDSSTASGHNPNQKFIVWITMPTGSAVSNCAFP